MRLTSPLLPIPLPRLLTDRAPNHAPRPITRAPHRPTDRSTHDLPRRLPVSRDELLLLSRRDRSRVGRVDLDGRGGGGERRDVLEETLGEEEDGEFGSGVEV